MAVRSAPDGYTMVLASTSEIAVNPAIYSRLSYDTLKDLAPVAMVASTPMVVIVGNALRNFDPHAVKQAGELAKRLAQVLADKYGPKRCRCSSTTAS